MMAYICNIRAGEPEVELTGNPFFANQQAPVRTSQKAPVSKIKVDGAWGMKSRVEI